MTALLIDRHLPEWDFAETHETSIRAPREVVYQALKEVDLNRLWLTRLLFLVRRIPALVRGRSALSLPGLTLEGLTGAGFLILEEEAGRELVLGLVGRPWAPSGDIRRVDARAFDEIEDPAVAKVAWNFLLEDLPQGATHLSTETRIRCLSEAARRRFRRYWRFIRPFSAAIRVEILTAVKLKAQVRSQQELAG